MYLWERVWQNGDETVDRHRENVRWLQTVSHEGRPLRDLMRASHREDCERDRVQDKTEDSSELTVACIT